MIYDFIFKNNRNKNTQFGDAKPMDWWRKRFYFARNTKNGYCIDGKQFLKEKHLFTHCLYVAPTESGKSTTIVNHLINIKKTDEYSLFILDVSGELETMTSKHLKEVGYTISRLDFSNPNESDTYNPLKRAMQSDNGIQELAELLVCPESKGTKNFWEQSSISLIETLLMGLLSNTQKDESKKNLLGLYNLINLIAVKPDEAIEFLEQNLDEEHYMDFASFMGLEPKLKSNILASAKAPLSKLKSKAIQKLTSTDTIDLLSLRTHKRALFLRLEEGKEKYYRFLLSIFITQLSEMALKMRVEGQKYNPIMMFWDEFPSFVVPQFPQWVSVLRKRKVALFIYVQSLSQIEENYNKNGLKTILGNMLSQVYFGKLSREECERIEKRLGTRTEEINGALRPMPAMRADEILGLKKHHCLYVNGADFTVLKILPWYNSRRMSKKVVELKK